MEQQKENGNLALNFALLEPRLPKTLNEITNNPLAYGESVRMVHQAEIFGQFTTRDERNYIAKQLRELFGATGSSSDLADTLALATRKAHEFIDWIVKEHLPESYFGTFSSDGIVRSTDKFGTLLHYWRQYSAQTDSLSVQREFEIRRAILLGFIFFELFLLQKDARRSGKIQSSIVEFLESRFFKANSTMQKTVVYYQDGNDNGRIKCCILADSSERVPEQYLRLSRLYHRFHCRVFQWNGKEYPVYFEKREKDDFSYVLKLFRLNERDPKKVFDQIGIKLVFFSDEALYAALEKIRMVVFVLPGVTWDYHDSLSGNDKGSSRNKYSCNDWHAIKSLTRCSGYCIEDIIERVIDYLNSILSTSNAHHALYKLKILEEKALPLLFPQEIYGIDWKSEKIRQELLDFHKAKIK